MQEVKKMVQRFEEFYNKYLTLPKYQATAEEIAVASQIVAGFETNQDSLPLCSNSIDRLISNYSDDYYSGESDIRAKIVSALVISKIRGIRALFVYKSKKIQKLHWYVTKTPEEMRRAIVSNLVLYGTPTITADDEGNRIIKIITDNSEILMSVTFVDEEGLHEL